MYIAFAKYLFEGTIFIEVIRILVVMQCCVTLKMMLTAEGCRYDYFFWVCFCSDIRAFWFGYCCHYSLLWIFSPFAISFMMIMVTLIKSWHITRFVLFLCKSIILLSLLIKSIRNISVFLMYSLLSCFSPNDDIVIFRTHRKSTTHYQFKWFQTGAFQCIFVTCTVRQLHFDLLKKKHISLVLPMSPDCRSDNSLSHHAITLGGGYRLLRACAYLRSTFLLGLHSRLNLSASRNKWPLRME